MGVFAALTKDWDAGAGFFLTSNRHRNKFFGWLETSVRFNLESQTQALDKEK